MSINEIDHFYPKSKKEWRKWLEKNHIQKDAIWVIFYKKETKKPTITWSEAVDEALCFGWIDSIKRKLDHERAIQYFSKRKANSTWSRINKDKVKILIESGQMTKMGMSCIDIAKENGTWTILDEVEDLIVPTDLENAFANQPKSKAFYDTLSKSLKKGILYWVISAKREETREKRINEIAELAAQGLLPRHIR